MKRREFITGIGGAAAVVLTASGCSGAGGTSSSTSGGASGEAGAATLRMALQGDMTTLDPTTSYQFEGSQVLTSVYEGLVEYAPDSSSTIVPLLAESHTVSADGLTYVFTIRSGVTFLDGSVLTSAGVKQSFERMASKKVASQMGYMVAGVKSYDTPDDATFVVNLTAPNASFLSLLASPFGPKIIDSLILEQYADDEALEHLKTHTAGTGPYHVTEFASGQQYTLTRNDSYWGTKPYFATVTFKIIGDVANQVLQLQGGDLDVISGQPIATVQSFVANDDFQVVALPLLQKGWLHVNRSGSLDDQQLREALRASIDRDGLVSQVWGEYATASTQLYPIDTLPTNLATDTWERDPAALAQLAGGRKITLGYIAGLAQDAQVAQTLQSQWQQAGVQVEVVPTQGADFYGFSQDPSKAPDLLYEASYPDSAHPDAWARLFFYRDTSDGSGGLNYLLAGSAESDTLMDTGLESTDPAAADEAYGRVGGLIHDEVSYIGLADLKDVFVARAGLTGFDHWLPTPRTFQLKSLTEAS